MPPAPKLVHTKYSATLETSYQPRWQYHQGGRAGCLRWPGMQLSRKVAFAPRARGHRPDRPQWWQRVACLDRDHAAGRPGHAGRAAALATAQGPRQAHRSRARGALTHSPRRANHEVGVPASGGAARACPRARCSPCRPPLSVPGRHSSCRRVATSTTLRRLRHAFQLLLLLLLLRQCGRLRHRSPYTPRRVT